MEQRPVLDKTISLDAFKDFYWLKKELMVFCRAEGLSQQGGKIAIAERIEKYLGTGEKENPKRRRSILPEVRTISKFDWSKEKLTPQTVIRNSYKNTENVRAFFKEQLGAHFKFSVRFMNWMKDNVGKNLAEAMIEWENIRVQQKKETAPQKIAPQFEYNTYLRDFLADNPGLSRATAIHYWKIKKSLRGDNQYRKEDLNYGSLE